MLEKQKELELLKGSGIQTKLNMLQGSGGAGLLKPSMGKVVNGQITYTAAEKEAFRKKMILNSQMQIFTDMYPHLVKGKQIQYPIDDKLIKLMPELHSSHMLKPPPQMKKVITSCDVFENLLYIWEFFNNFSDFLEIPIFNLQEL